MQPLHRAGSQRNPTSQPETFVLFFNLASPKHAARKVRIRAERTVTSRGQMGNTSSPQGHHVIGNISGQGRHVMSCGQERINRALPTSDWSSHVVQELCESRGGRPELSVLTSLLVSVDVQNY